MIHWIKTKILKVYQITFQVKRVWNLFRYEKWIKYMVWGARRGGFRLYQSTADSAIVHCRSTGHVLAGWSAQLIRAHREAWKSSQKWPNPRRKLPKPTIKPNSMEISWNANIYKFINTFLSLKLKMPKCYHDFQGFLLKIWKSIKLKKIIETQA